MPKNSFSLSRILVLKIISSHFIPPRAATRMRLMKVSLTISLSFLFVFHAYVLQYIFRLNVNDYDDGIIVVDAVVIMNIFRTKIILLLLLNIKFFVFKAPTGYDVITDDDNEDFFF